MYQILYEKRILKDLDRIPNEEVEKIVNLFKKLLLNPAPIGSKKLSGRIGLYRLRCGDYRIVYTIKHKEKQIKIVLVSHRKDAYRQL